MLRLQSNPADDGNSFHDVSGIPSSASINPYDALIISSANEPVGRTDCQGPFGIELICWCQTQIQARYDTHRLTRNEQQKAKFLDPAFTGLILDPILQKLENPELQHGYVDPRHCLVFWARPTIEIRDLVASIQQKLRRVAPSMTRSRL
jgi:vesicle-fusing ATPase